MKRAILEIDIPSPPTEGNCTTSLFVKYRLTGDPNWTLLNGIGTYILAGNEVIIEPLAASTAYQASIVRNCCNGLESDELIYEFTTPA